MKKNINDAYILIVDDNHKNLQVLGEMLTEKGYQIGMAKNGEQALKAVKADLPDLILLDIMMPVLDGFETCKQLKGSSSTQGIPIIFLTAKIETEDIVKGFELGAVDYIIKPFQISEVVARVKTQLELKLYKEHLEELVAERTAEINRLKERLQAENVYLREEIETNYKYKEIIGHSDTLKEVLIQVEQVAKTDSTVLLLGKTGTGKELLARAIHDLSSRKNRTMVKMNCAALPMALVESELFGHEKGAYTGALSKQTGRFEIANDSTLFMDEIGELPLELQAKLLRVLQEGQFERLGSSKTITVDVRIIAATNQNLDKAVKEGRFREDLYYRLNVFPITVPPLCERQEDIPLLVWTFIKEFGETMGKNIESIPQKTMTALQHYPWPGNIRELRNMIERAMILSQGGTLQIKLPKTNDISPSPQMTLEEIERNHIMEVLDSTYWRVSGQNGAAEILGLKPTTLFSRIKKLGIERS